MNSAVQIWDNILNILLVTNRTIVIGNPVRYLRSAAAFWAGGKKRNSFVRWATKWPAFGFFAGAKVLMSQLRWWMGTIYSLCFKHWNKTRWSLCTFQMREKIRDFWDSISVEIYIRLSCKVWASFFFNHLFRITQRWQTYKCFRIRKSMSDANPGLKMREHFRFCYCIFFI
jgi:hypothetical protein